MRAAFFGLLLAAAAHAQPIRPCLRFTPGTVVTSDPDTFCHPGYSRAMRHIRPGALGSIPYRAAQETRCANMQFGGWRLVSETHQSLI